MKDSSDVVTVIDVASRQFTTSQSTTSNLWVGVGASMTGIYSEVYGYYGESSWNIGLTQIRDNQKQMFTVTTDHGLPNGAAVLNFDASILAYSVYEYANGSNEKTDRSYFYRLTDKKLITILEDAAEPVFCETGDIFFKRADRLMVTNKNFESPEILPVPATNQLGAFSPSGDCRFIAYHEGQKIRIYDRSTKRTWTLSQTFGRSLYFPVFSPDGNWVAFFEEGVVALRYLHIVKFSLNETQSNLDDSTLFKSTNGDGFVGLNRISWTR